MVGYENQWARSVRKCTVNQWRAPVDKTFLFAFCNLFTVNSCTYMAFALLSNQDTQTSVVISEATWVRSLKLWGPNTEGENSSTAAGQAWGHIVGHREAEAWDNTANPNPPTEFIPGQPAPSEDAFRRTKENKKLRNTFLLTNGIIAKGPVYWFV